MSLELANAITLSSHTGQSVTLPLDRGGGAALLADLQAGGVEAGGARFIR